MDYRIAEFVRFVMPEETLEDLVDEAKRTLRVNTRRALMRASVKDSFNLGGRLAVEYGSTGVIVIFSPFDGEEPPMPGDRVLVVKPDGWIRTALIGEVKLTADAPGFFLSGLDKQDVPIGTRLWWGSDISAGFMEKMVLASAG